VEESERELAASAEVAATEKKGQGLNAAFLVSLAARFGDASAPLPAVWQLVRRAVWERTRKRAARRQSSSTAELRR
jgi:hypothetical protein